MEADEVSIDALIEKQFLSGDMSIVPFRIGNKCIAVPSSQVITISDQVAIHTIPFNKTPLIKGLVAINHEIYTFISLIKLLSLEPRKLNTNVKKLHSLFKRTLVVDLDGRIVAFYVDEVYPIYRYFQKDVQGVDEKSAENCLLQGVIKNKGDWCDDCQFLNASLAATKIEVTDK